MSSPDEFYRLDKYADEEKLPNQAMELDSESIRQLENIARAIQLLEGMAVPYSLAIRLHHVMLDIASLCAPSRYSQASELDADQWDAERGKS